MDLLLLQGFAIENQALVLLLMLPVVVTIVGIARHIIGIKSLGIYAPIALTFSLYGLGLSSGMGDYSDILAGLRYGMIFLVVLVAATVVGSSIVRGSRMHYFPKMSLVISFAAIALLVTIIIGDILLGSVMGNREFSAVNALALVMIASVAEQFTAIQFKIKLRKAILLTAETAFISIFCYLLIAWPSFQDFILNYPYLVIVSFLINYLVGKYRGLRFRELLRFGEVLDTNDDN